MSQKLLKVLESFKLPVHELAEHNVFTLQDVKNLKDPENLYIKLGVRYRKLVEYVKGLSEDQVEEDEVKEDEVEEDEVKNVKLRWVCRPEGYKPMNPEEYKKHLDECKESAMGGRR